MLTTVDLDAPFQSDFSEKLQQSIASTKKKVVEHVL
jgi:hypothetical protein